MSNNNNDKINNNEVHDPSTTTATCCSMFSEQLSLSIDRDCDNDNIRNTNNNVNNINNSVSDTSNNLDSIFNNNNNNNNNVTTNNNVHNTWDSNGSSCESSSSSQCCHSNVDTISESHNDKKKNNHKRNNTESKIEEEENNEQCNICLDSDNPSSSSTSSTTSTFLFEEQHFNQSHLKLPRKLKNQKNVKLNRPAALKHTFATERNRTSGKRRGHDVILENSFALDNNTQNRNTDAADTAVKDSFEVAAFKIAKNEDFTKNENEKFNTIEDRLDVTFDKNYNNNNIARKQACTEDSLSAQKFNTIEDRLDVTFDKNYNNNNIARKQACTEDSLSAQLERGLVRSQNNNKQSVSAYEVKRVTYDLKNLYRVKSDAPTGGGVDFIRRGERRFSSLRDCYFDNHNMLFQRLRNPFSGGGINKKSREPGKKGNRQTDGNKAGLTRIRKNSQRRSTSAELIREFLGPADTPVNARLFGGKKAVQVEIERMKSYGYVIHPCSKLRQYWDLLIMTMLVLNMMVLPLDIAFFDDSSFIIFHVVSDALCMVDIILNFQTGYHLLEKKHEFELGHKKIAIHYLKTWFTLDLISSLPLHYILLAVSGQNVTLGLKGATRALKFLKVAKLLNLLKLLRLSRIIRGIAQYEEVYCVTTSFVRYIKLVCMMLMVAHWNGCLHFLIPMLRDFPDQCWVRLCGIVNEPWYVQYGWALFKTLSHMLCIGYGRYIPALLDEALLTIFSMVTGATFYALFIAHSMAFIIRRDSSKTTYQEKIKQIEEYMQYRNVPTDTKKRISNYFEHKYHQGRYFDETEIMSVIGKPLRAEIVLHTCQDLVESVPFLKAAPPHFVTAVLNSLTFDVYLSGDNVIKEGTIGEEMFFVRKGCLDVSVHGRKIHQLADGDYFGDVCMLTDDTRHIISVKARSTCDLFALSYKTLSDILNEFPDIRPMLEQAALNQLMKITQTIELANAAKEKDARRKSNGGEEGKRRNEGAFHANTASNTTATTANDNSDIQTTKRKTSLSRTSSLNHLKELINKTVENLASKIKNFKDEDQIITETMDEDSIAADTLSPYNTPQKEDSSITIVKDGGGVVGAENNKDEDLVSGPHTSRAAYVSTSF